MSNETDWLAEQIETQPPFVPTFPGTSVNSLPPLKRSALIEAASAVGVRPCDIAGISTCGRYAISFGTAPGDLRFTPFNAQSL
jgi:hypothetical protein